MVKEVAVPLFGMTKCLADAVDLVSPLLANHHLQTAYIAQELANELRLPGEEQSQLIFAGLLHDSGALSLQEKLNAAQFHWEGQNRHGEVGFMLFRGFEPLARAAEIIRHHHLPWEEGKEIPEAVVPFSSHLLHLADRVAVSIDKRSNVLTQAGGIVERISSNKGKMFAPELVNVFKCLAEKESFWLNIVSLSLFDLLSRRAGLMQIRLDSTGLFKLAGLFSRIIDFRSRFTAVHSSGVASVAAALAKLFGFSENECQMMQAAGHLHDLGKLSIPETILEKPGRLSPEEYCIIKAHTYYTFKILDSLSELKVINTWASYHHERLDGKGYPFRLQAENLSMGSRIMAVADVFTAITEDRPYRQAMGRPEALRVLNRMSQDKALDEDVVAVLQDRFDAINSVRMAAQADILEKHQDLIHAG
jgi:HD-GYP domain-containing protein (c-di-GMP phosphodiesterase class II)